MQGYELKIKLAHFQADISRVLRVPDTITFDELDSILKLIFNFSSFHRTKFNFPGLNMDMLDLGGGYMQSAVDFDGVLIKDYFEFFKKFTWTYDFGDDWEFAVKIKNIKNSKEYPEVISFTGKYNPEEDFKYYFEEFMFYFEKDLELPEDFDYRIGIDIEGSFKDMLTEFNIDEINNKLQIK